MQNTLTKLRAKLPLVLITALGVVGCSSGSDDTITPPAPPPPPPPPPVMAAFDVTVSNLTNAQPLSPIAVILHGDEYRVFSVGSPATVGLETLAEGGDNSSLIAEADADAGVLATASGTAPIGPAGSETVRIEIEESALANARLSVSTMLVNTNDAFSGVNALRIGELAVDATSSVRSIAYDSGTEANTETAATIPGPAGGGEGFNAVRDDRMDQVAMHAGVVSQDDGFASSDLSNQHRFDNPVVGVSITRVE